MFGIKNAGRSAFQDKFIVVRGVNQLIAGRFSARLGDDHMVLGDDVIYLSRSCAGSCNRLIWCALIPWLQEYIHVTCHDCQIRSFGLHSIFKVGLALAVSVAEPGGSDLYRRNFSTLLSLNQDRKSTRLNSSHS